jgi:hypothetical protein
MRLHHLPTQVAALLDGLNASPRLVAHLTLGHDVAATLVAALHRAWSTLVYGRGSVLLGAATHAIGKMLHPQELSRPGHGHEDAGVALRERAGCSQEQARFARTHAQTANAPSLAIEDLLVALADSLWRGKRDQRLKAASCEHHAL